MMIIFAALAAAILFGWSYFYRRIWTRGLTVDLHFENSTAYAGEQAALTEIITNRKKIPLPEIEVAFRFPKNLYFTDADNVIVSDFVYKRDIFSLRGMEAVTRRYSLDCSRRGRYPISQAVVRARSPMHRSEYEYAVTAGDELLVYAANCDVSDILARCSSVIGSVESRQRFLEDPFTFASVREYTTTDPLKTINWKATARTGSLMTNTFGSVRSEQFFILLDVSDQRILKEEILVEKGISAAASLCRALIRKGLDIGFALNLDPPVYMEPKRGSLQLRQIEQLLTTDFTQEKLTDFESFLLEAAKGPVSDGGQSTGNNKALTAGSSSGRMKHAITEENRIPVVISKEPAGRLDKALQALRSSRKQPVLWVQPVLEEGFAVCRTEILS